MGALAADRQAPAVTQAAVGGQVHQALDVDRGLAAQVALDGVVVVDRLADLQDLGVGQLVHPTALFDAHLGHDVLGGLRADAVDVLQRDLDALVGGNVDACDAGHVLSLRITHKNAKRPRPSSEAGEPAHDECALSRKGWL